MDAGLSRTSLTVTDSHQWHTYEQYLIVHERRLAEHTFVNHANPHTLVFEEIEYEGIFWIHLEGDVYCHEKVILKVEKWFETRTINNRVQVRGQLYRYVGYQQSGHIMLKYHNLHEDPNDYIHRAFNLDTGRQVFSETLRREQFPTFSEVLDELRVLTQYTRQS